MAVNTKRTEQPTLSQAYFSMKSTSFSRESNILPLYLRTIFKKLTHLVERTYYPLLNITLFIYITGVIAEITELKWVETFSQPGRQPTEQTNPWGAELKWVETCSQPGWQPTEQTNIH
jgi:hypothetical protein